MAKQVIFQQPHGPWVLTFMVPLAVWVSRPVTLDELYRNYKIKQEYIH